MRLSSLPWNPIIQRELSCREWFRYAKNIGLDGVELMDGWMNPAWLNLNAIRGEILQVRNEVFQPQVISRLKDELSEFGHSVSMLTVHNRFCRFSAREQQEEVDQLRVCMEVAKEFGTNRLRVIAAGWPQAGTDILYRDAMEACVDTIWRCVETADSEGFYLLLENHPGLSVDVDGYTEILRRVDSPCLGANLDCKNTRRVDKRPTEFLEKEEVISRLMCLHIDNFIDTPKGWNRSVSVDEGEVDIAAVLYTLKDYGYDGWLSIEYGGSGIEKVGKSAGYIRSVWGG